MTSRRSRSAAGVNVKLLLIAAAVLVIAAGGIFVGHKLRKRMMVAEFRRAGLAAYDAKDGDVAREQLERYLYHYPDDVGVLPKFAELQLAVRPLEPGNINRAIASYRRIFRQRPEDADVFAQLSRLYEFTGNFEELGHVARRRLEVVPDDPAATVARAKALLSQQKPDEARGVLAPLLAALEQQSDPDRDAYVDACLLLARIELGPGAARSGTSAVEWLDRAVAFAPESGLARAYRSVARLQALEEGGTAQREAVEQAVREDLEAALEQGGDDPRVLLLACEQWVRLRDLSRADACLTAAADVPEERIVGWFIDPRGWEVAQFQQAARIALLRGDGERGAALADAILEGLDASRLRYVVLPTAIELYAAAGRVADARTNLDTYLEAVELKEIAPAGPDSLRLLQARVAQAEGRYHEVIALLEPLVGQSATAGLASAMLAEAYERTGQSGRLLTKLRAATVQPHLSPVALERLGRELIRQGQWQAAVEAFRTLEAARGDVESRLLRISAELDLALRQGGGPSEALDALTAEVRALQDEAPDDPRVAMTLASCAAARGDLDAARVVLERITSGDEAPLSAWLQLGQLYLLEKDAKAAREAFESACAQHPAEMQGWTALAELHAQQGADDEAADVLRRAREAITDDEARRELDIRLAINRIAAGDRAPGVARLREIAAASPQDVAIRDLLLSFPETAQDAAAAERLIAEIRDVEGDSGLTWRFHEARRLFAQSDWRARVARIEELLKFCLDNDAVSPPPALLLGALYERLGRPRDAEAIYAQSFQRNGSPEVADRLLVLYQRQQRFADARQLLQELQGRLDAEAMSDRLLRIQIGSGDYAAALQQLELRAAGDQNEPMSLVYLAELRYRQEGDVAGAMAALDRAAEAGADPVTVARTRAAILRSEDRVDESFAVLDALIAEHPTPEAYLVRAAFYRGTGRAAQAEQDFIEVCRLSKDASGFAFLGEFYARDGRLDEAIATWQQGLAAHPEALSLKVALVKAWLMRNAPGDRESLSEMLPQIEAERPEHADTLWLRGLERAQAGTPETRAEAVDCLRRAVQATAGNAETYEGLVRLAIQIGEVALARDLAAKGAGLFPTNTNLLAMRAETELATGNTAAAIAAAESALVRGDVSVAAARVLGQTAAARQDTVRLRALAVRVRPWVDGAPDDVNLRLLLADIDVALDQVDAARRMLEEFCAREPGSTSVPALTRLHELCRQQGDFEAAERWLAQAEAREPESLALIRQRLLLLDAQGDHAALAATAKAFEGPPLERAELCATAATLLARSPDHRAEAIALAREATALAPNEPRAYAMLGELLYSLGDPAAAEEAFRAVLRLNPNDPDALNNVAWVVAERGGNLDEAATLSQQAVALAPDNADFHNTLGYVLQRIPGRESAALEAYQRSIALAQAGTRVRGESLRMLARLVRQTQRWDAIRPYLTELRELRDADEGLSAEERRELESLLAEFDTHLTAAGN